MADLYSMRPQSHLGARDKYDIIVVLGEVRFECATSFHGTLCTVFFCSVPRSFNFRACTTSGQL